MLIILIFMAVGINNAYWLTLLNVTNLKGNKFINGIILGAGETASGFFSGFVINMTSSTTAFQLLGILAISLNAINMFATAEGSFLAYLSLFCAILGVGGSYASLYVVIAESVPTA